MRTEEEATEISLAENLIRSDMHPADAFSAFSKLAEEGKSVADIAARFGKTEHHVKQRLALARVSPVIIQLYREEEISFEQLQAFTVSDDHAEQERVWNELPSWNKESYTIRRTLASAAISATDKRVRFIGGLEAFELAGGSVRRDLFDKPDSGFVLDAAKLESMVAEKLQDVMQQVKAEGWANVEIIPEYDHASTCHLQRYWPEKRPLSEQEQAELDALEAESDELEGQIENGDGDEEETAEAESRIEAINKLMMAVEQRAQTYAPEVIATGTAFISLDYQGRPSIQRGFAPREEQANEGGSDNDNASSKVDGETAAKAEITYPATLIESLSAQKTAILRAELMNNSHVALAATVHALLLKVNGATRYDAQTCLKLSVSVEAIDRRVEMTGGSIALDEVLKRAEQVGETIPGKPADLWEWCLEQSTQKLLDLLAFAAAQSVNIVVLTHDSNSEAVQHSHRLAEALNIDMTGWYQATGETCFKHLNRNSIQIAVEQAAGSQAALAIASAKKKAEAVVIAERLLKDTNWLPEPIRFKQLDAAVVSEPESIDDIENDDDADFETDDFEEAAE